MDLLARQYEFELRASGDGDGLTLEGYAAVFNQWTEINSRFEGHFLERVAPGAFTKTLQERTPVLQFDHGSHPLIGSIPLGVFRSIKEDTYGLHVVARLSDNWLVAPVRDAIRDGAITGMSFRFKPITGRDVEEKPMRPGGLPRITRHEVALYEAGPVVMPAYSQTSVSVRSQSALTLLLDPDVRAELAHLLVTSDRAADEAPGSDADALDPVEEQDPVRLDDEPDAASPPAETTGFTPHRHLRAALAAQRAKEMNL